MVKSAPTLSKFLLIVPLLLASFACSNQSAPQQNAGPAATQAPAPDKTGAPPTWEQVGQDEQLANSNAAAAYRAEIDGPEGTLGVRGAMPSYAKPQTAQTSHNTSTTPAR